MVHAQAQDANTPYPNIAPLEQYLMPERDSEIALARTAAPDSISRDATILVLGKQGYVTAVEGPRVGENRICWAIPFFLP